jgi:hypothetical protein
MSAQSDPAGDTAAEPAPWHYDGRNANRWHPRIVLRADGFQLLDTDWASGPYAWTDLIALDGTGGRSVYGLRGEKGWRLGFDGPPPPDFAAHLPLPARYGRLIDRIGLGRAVLAFGAIAAIIVYIGLEAPGWVAPYIPASWENRLGDAMVGDFGGRFCRTPAGTRALKDLAGRMDPEGSARAIEVANIPMVNAITLPGGRIILFDGLLQKAKSPDEVAGVLGHELGHVHHRDTITALVRQLGLSIVLGGFSGQVGGYMNGLLSLSYGRSAESAADTESIARMKAANVSPADTAAFFDRIGDGQKGRTAQAMTWLSTHPLSDARRVAFASSVVKNHGYAPALNSTDWQALKSMCASDPKAEKGFPGLF